VRRLRNASSNEALVMEKKTTSDPFFNLADALAEDILASQEQELLREAVQDHSDPFALSKKFDEIVERVSGPQESAQPRKARVD
jgi:hypothetical protein